MRATAVSRSLAVDLSWLAASVVPSSSCDQRDLGIGYSERCDRFLQGYDVSDANFRKSSVAKDLSGQLGWHPGGD